MKMLIMFLLLTKNQNFLRHSHSKKITNSQYNGKITLTQKDSLENGPSRTPLSKRTELVTRATQES